MRGFDYHDLGGGLNQAHGVSQIDSREMTALANWYPLDGKLRRRGGTRKLTTGGTWAGQEITSMFPLKKSDGTWVLIVGGLSKFGKLDGNSIVDLPLGTGVSLASSAVPWRFFMYKDFLYALRAGAGLFRIDNTVLAAGIGSPSAAPTLAQGIAGSLVAGTYGGVYTFANRATNYEGNPSPVGSVTIAASKTINYTSIATSANPFVDARRIYRTLADQVGVYFFVHEISDNVGTDFFSEDTSVANLGRSVSFRNGLPPNNLITAVIWNDMMIATDGTDVFFSEPLLIEMFSTDFLPVFPDDGHKIRALHAFGDRCIIGKTNKVHFLIGTSRANFAIRTLSDRHGCMSHHSMQSAEGRLFWYGSGKSVLSSDGTTPRDISEKVKPFLELIPDDREEYVLGAIFEKLHWYVLSIPQVDTFNRVVLVYNYKDDTWTTFTHPSAAPQFIGDFFNTNYGHILYSTFYDGHLYVYNDTTYGLDDTAVDLEDPHIAASFTTRADDFGLAGHRKAFDQVWLLIPQVIGGTLRLEVLADALSSAIADRTVSLDIAGSSWKAYKLPTWGRPGTKIQVRATYKGVPSIDVEKIHFEVGTDLRPPMQPV